MGKGDRRTRQGKVWRGSYGKTRPRKRKRPETAEAVSKPNAGQP